MKSYLLDGSSIRRLGIRWNVAPSTAWKRIQRTLPQGAGLGTLCVRKPLPQTDIILLDAKHFKIRKQTYTLYVCMDARSRTPLCWILLPRHETREGYDLILSHLRSKRFKIEATVSDNDQSIRASIDSWYPEAIQQKCAFHVLKKAFGQLNGRRLIQTERGKKIWNMIRKIALEYEDRKKARSYLLKMKRRHPAYTTVWKTLERNLEDIYQFEKKPDLPIPRTSNKIENFMGVLEQRLKSFRSSKSADALIKIICAYVRLKYKSPTN